MKKIYSSILFLFFVTNFFATDLVVNSSGQPGTYTTLSAALSAAASSGDRILIPSTITLIEDITINKSIDIMPQTEDNYFYLEGDINVTANAGLEIRILGMNYSGNLVCSAGTAVETNRCDLYFIECNITDPGVTELDANVQGLGFHVLYCNIPDIQVKFRFGEIIASKLAGFFVKPGDGVNYGDTVKIIANIIDNSAKFDADGAGGFFENCTFPYYSTNYDWYNWGNFFSTNVWDNIDHYFFIANNYINNQNNESILLAFLGTDTITPGRNKIINNTFRGTGDRELEGNGIGNTRPYYYIRAAINIFDTYNSNSSYSKPLISWTNPNLDILNNIFAYNGYFNAGYGAHISCGRRTVENNTTYPNPVYSPFVKYNLFSSGTTLQPSNFNDASNFEIDPFNYAQASTIFTTGNTTYDDNNGKGLTGAVIDGGKNEASSYDIDMTRNDLGTYGGPYSMENYWDSTATGKARIYQLDMPSEIWSGQTPTIKASAVHKK